MIYDILKKYTLRSAFLWLHFFFGSYLASKLKWLPLLPLADLWTPAHSPHPWPKENQIAKPVSRFSLTFPCKIKNKNQCLTRCSLFLHQCNLIVKHITGTQNLAPDVLFSVIFSIESCMWSYGLNLICSVFVCSILAYSVYYMLSIYMQLYDSVIVSMPCIE